MPPIARRSTSTRTLAAGLPAVLGLSLCLAPLTAAGQDLVVSPPDHHADVHPAVGADRSADGASLHGHNPLLELSDRFADVADRVRPSVVYIDVAQSRTAQAAPRVDEDALRRLPPQMREFFRQQPDREQRPNLRQRRSSGSGWVWDDAGHIITNAHVVKNADRVTVRTADGRSARAEVLGLDESTDVAVLKIDPDGLRLQPAERAAQEARQGQLVFAFGSPFRQQFSMSQGIVSGVDRMTGILGSRGFESFIQTDAAINPGNSGGPLTDAAGRVLGMNSAILSRTGAFAGIGFAIPLEVLEPVVDQLLDTGQVRRGQLGIRITDEPALVRSFGVTRGVVVDDVLPGTPAEQAGLAVGDVIVAVDGDATPSVHVLRAKIGSLRPDTPVELTLVRSGERMNLTARVGASTEVASTAAPDAAPAEAVDRLTRLGLGEVQALDRDLAEEAGLDLRRGVLVGAVEPGSPAFFSGVRPGVVIVSVMGERVNTPRQLAEAFDGYETGDPVRLRIARPDGALTYVVIEMPEDFENAE
ncbi:MAG: trypsin-like peptidase domain-containing protein [Planctomycetota bacterium]